MKKNRLAFVFTYIWMLLLLCAGVLVLLFADKEERASETENRMLAGFPAFTAKTVFSGDFSSGFESFLSDGVFMRDKIAGASDSLLGIFSAASYEDTMLLDSIAMAEEISGSDGQAVMQSAEEALNTAEAAPLPEAGQQMQSLPGNTGDLGLFLTKEDGSLELLSDVYESDIKRVADILNCYRDFLPQDGKVFYSCVPLTSYRDVAVKSGQYTGWHENLEERFSEYLTDGAYMVSAPNVLNEHLMDETLYFQADHHWTPLAAYYLIEEMMQMQGVPVVPYDEYDYLVNRFTNATTGQGDDLDLMYPLQDVKANLLQSGKIGESVPFIVYDYNYYVAYLAGGNHVWTKYESGFSTGRNALVIGDSFTTAFLPYLLPYYDSVHRADPRYYDKSLNGGGVGTLVEQYDIDDVYIVLSYDNGVDSSLSKQTLEYILYD